ncbi:MAG TPA: methyltransferase domain-containing protein [Bryobacteraceae bacterium]|nr:methyltransferase domain-containing protein [Bryobacteraceae bacterium]
MNDEPAMNQPEAVSERMRQDWNQRAREDPHYYVAFGRRDQDEEGFLATAGDVLRSLETELKRFSKDANRRAWRALEIGCGPGRLMKPMSRHFGEIHGVDVSDEMIGLARERLRDIPHAHVYATNGASLAHFADESFDFVYSYAVFQHIPSRDVVLEYMRETRRVLKPGGIFRGQFNGLPHSEVPDTWSGVVFSPEDIRTFTRENGFQLLSLEGVETQYMWTAWRKKGFSPAPAPHAPPAVRRVTHAYSFEPVAPNRERHAAISIWMENLPDDCDLNNLEVDIDRTPAEPFFIGWPIAEGVRQVNVWLPKGVRTGLLPVELRLNGVRLCAPGTVRVIPAGPQVPRIVSITDGVNLVQKNASSSRILKVQLEEVGTPESLTATVGDQPVERLEIKCIDPRAPRHEVNLRLPENLSPGHHRLLVRVGRWRLPAEIDILT